MPIIHCRPIHDNQNVRFPDWGDTPAVAYYPEAAAFTGYGWRIYTQIPPGATINLATLRIQNSAKFADQSASVTSRLFYQSSANADPLVAGATTWNSWSNAGRLSADNGATYTSTYTANGGNQYTDLNMTAEVTGLMNTYGLVPGGHISFGMVIDSESGDFRYGNYAELIIDYTPAASPTTYWDFNMMSNPDFYQDTYSWDTNQQFFGSIQAGGTLTKDNTMLRNGVSSGKFTVPTPDGSGKSTGFTTYVDLSEDNAPYIFCGFIYIPAALPPVYAQFFYNGFVEITGARDTWQPFCTPVHNIGSWGVAYPAITIGNGFTAGQSIWLNDCAVFKSSFRQNPWTARTPTRSGIVHHFRDYTTRGPHVRSSTPKSRVIDSANGGTTAARRAYKLEGNGLWTEAGESKI